MVGDPVSFPPQAFFKNELLGRVERLEIKALLDVEGWILDVLNGGAGVNWNKNVTGVVYSVVRLVLMGLLELL